MSIDLSPILRRHTEWALIFFCPGCKHVHSIPHAPNPHVQGGGPVWGWNGSVDKPTFTPSLLVRSPANPDASEEFKEWRTERVCHSFIVDGRIQFLGDCTHELAGQTVDIPEWPENPYDER